MVLGHMVTCIMPLNCPASTKKRRERREKTIEKMKGGKRERTIERGEGKERRKER